MLDGSDLVGEVEATGAGHGGAGAGPGSELGPATEEGADGASELEDWSEEDWIAGTGVNLGGQPLRVGLVLSQRWSLLQKSLGGWWWTAIRGWVRAGQWNWMGHSRPLLQLWRWLELWVAASWPCSWD